MKTESLGNKEEKKKTKSESEIQVTICPRMPNDEFKLYANFSFRAFSERIKAFERELPISTIVEEEEDEVEYFLPFS